MREEVKLAHGSGGKETQELLNEVIISLLEEKMKKVEGGVGTDELDDGAAIPIPGGYAVITVDSYTVKPYFFPGGDIGELAASGTINDLLMMGAKPLAILDSIVVEEGFPLADLRRITESMVDTLRRVGVKLVGGDVKVIPKGGLDGIVITTTGLGFAERIIVDSSLKPGDKIIVSGTVGDHGAAILAAQEGLEVEGGIESDVAPLHDLMIPLIEEYSSAIHAAQDPTRGGLAQTLNEWASKTGYLIAIEEGEIPIKKEVRAFTELLGVDPLSLACEGKAVLGVAREKAGNILRMMRDLGFEDASIIGEVRESKRYGGMVVIKSLTGGLRILEPPSGVIVPRIC